ncbi:hypothetical protein [Pseudalkalibacillus hwajinpoensis]|uniref:hypothetical protein n=1 Tax=Guptibacillus hwajinpoensis TaxID=208199 RepID=UPI001CFE5522|nr:hypothetical protein [Pseudalkalibacillus hwajinpoensis]
MDYQFFQDHNKDNKYIIESVKHYKNNIDKFIKIYSIKEALQEKLIDSKVDSVNKFNEKLSINSIKELILDIEEFYEFICINKNTLTSQYLRYFSSLLIHLERYTINYEFDSEIINKIEELYNFLPADEYDENSEEKRTWLWCTVKLGEIKENLKKLQLQEVEEAVEEDESIVDDD